MFRLFILRKWSSPYHPPTQTDCYYLCIQLKHRDWRRELLQQGKGEKEGRFLTTWTEKLINPGEAGGAATYLTDTEGRTYRQDHENTQSKYSTLKFIARLITNNNYTVNCWNKHFLKFYIYWLTQVDLRPRQSTFIVMTSLSTVSTVCHNSTLGPSQEDLLVQSHSETFYL